MNRYNHYRIFYENELRDKKDIDNSINIPILIVTLIFAGVSYFLENLNYNPLKFIDKLLLVLIVLTLLFLCVGIYRIIMSYNNGIKSYKYNIIGLAKHYEEYRTELYKTHDGRMIIAESEFEESIVMKFIECIDHNMKLNAVKNYHLNRAKTNIIISLIIIFFTFFVFHLKQVI